MNGQNGMEIPNSQNEVGGSEKEWKMAEKIDQKGTNRDTKGNAGFEPPDPRLTDIRYTESKRLFAEYSRGRLTADQLAEHLKKLETGATTAEDIVVTDMFIEPDPFTEGINE